MNPPIQERVTDQNSKLTVSWIDFISQMFLTTNSLLESGTTAQRPTKNLWVGRMFWDSTLQKPIWYSGTNWKDAAGIVV